MQRDISAELSANAVISNLLFLYSVKECIKKKSSEENIIVFSFFNRMANPP